MFVNVFPDLLSYAFYVPLLLRLLLAVIFLDFGYAKLTKEKNSKAEFFETIGLRPGGRFVLIFGILELAIAAALAVGLYTQLAALLAALILVGTIIIKYKHPTLLPSSRRYYAVLLIVSVSLLLTGAGAYSIDLPL